MGAGQVRGDISEAEVAEVSQRVVGQGLVDYVNVTMGDYYAMHWMMGGMDRPAGYMLGSSGQVTAAVSGVPRLVTGRFRTLEEVEQVLREGAADIVSMVRAHIADPDLVRKTREGRAHEVRPCIGCNQGCIARTAGRDLRMACTVNPAVGYELTLAEDLIGTTADPRRVVVVGGGPAGMEAARTARLRGHEVILFEAYPALGGTLNVLRQAPMMQGFEDIADWLRQEIDRLGVDVRTGIHVDADEVMAQHPDDVIVAAGAEPVLDGRLIAAPGEPVMGIGLPHVLTSIELLTGARPELGTTALVVDDLGSYEAVAVAEFLLHRGVAVTVATRHPEFGGLVEAAMRMEPALVRLHAVGPTFTVHARSQLLEVRAGTPSCATARRLPPRSAGRHSGGGHAPASPARTCGPALKPGAGAGGRRCPLGPRPAGGDPRGPYGGPSDRLKASARRVLGQSRRFRRGRTTGAARSGC